MLFWATIALGLFYLAYRYNILFVTDTQVDTHGLFYPRALQHLFFGIYIAEISMVGMFAVSKAPGPGALIGSFFIFTILYHITLKRSLGPLFLSLPRTLQANEQQIYRSDSSGLDGARGNILTRFLKPWVYSNYEILRYLVRPKSTIGPYVYNDETLKNAYLPPSVTSTAPVLWIPRDRAGMSKIEVALTKTVICISDEGCELDENNKLQWNTEGVRPPIWREKIHY